MLGRVQGGAALRYRVYGITMETDVQLAVRLPATDADPDLVFELNASAPGEIDLEPLSRVYTEGRRDDGRPHFEYWALDDRDVVRITGVADFHCWPSHIVCHLRDADHRYLVEVALFGMVLALWLERRGTPTLHGSGVVVDGKAVGFLAGRGTGKTSTAAACVASGMPMLSDDLLALEEQDGQILAHPGYPQFRMWPAQARHFVGTDRGHQRIHPGRDKMRIDVGNGFGTFQAEATSLVRLYVPERADDAGAEVRMTPLRPREGMLALLRHSFLPRESARFGLQAGRFPFLAQLVRRVPILRLVVPNGLDQLPRVVDAIRADVRSC
jgi:hypothetical protein